MLADTGLQGLFQYDATVTTTGVITELTATKVMLTESSFTQNTHYYSVQKHIGRHTKPSPSPSAPSSSSALLSHLDWISLCLLRSSPKVNELIWAATSWPGLNKIKAKKVEDPKWRQGDKRSVRAAMAELIPNPMTLIGCGTYSTMNEIRRRGRIQRRVKCWDRKARGKKRTEQDRK